MFRCSGIKHVAYLAMHGRQGKNREAIGGIYLTYICLNTKPVPPLASVVQHDRQHGLPPTKKKADRGGINKSDWLLSHVAFKPCFWLLSYPLARFFHQTRARCDRLHCECKIAHMHSSCGGNHAAIAFSAARAGGLHWVGLRAFIHGT